MSSSIDLNSPYQIDDFVVSPHLDQLEYKGVVIKLEPKVMALLSFLVKNQGNVCSKSDISEALWPRQEITDEAITRLVFVLRNHLGDNAKSPKYISTVARKGYVFLASPKQVSNAPSFNRKIWLLLIPVLLAAILYTFVFNAPSGYKVVRTLPVTHADGREYSYTGSKSFFAYLHHSGSNTSVIFVPQGKQPETLVKDSWHKRNLLAVDNFLLYIRFNSFEYQIVRQSLTGEIDVLVSTESPIYSLTYDNAAQNIIYNQHINNERVVLNQYSFAKQTSDSLGSESNLLPAKIELPTLSDQAEILYFVGIKSRKPTLYKLNRGSENHPEILSTEFDLIVDIQLGGFKNELLIAGTKGFTHGVWQLDLNNLKLTLVSKTPNREVSDIFLDHTDSSLYLSTREKRTDLAEINFRGKKIPIAGLNSTTAESHGQYQPHNDDIYFTSNRTGSFEIYHYKNSSQKVTKITQLEAAKVWYFAVSADQKSLAVVYSTDHIYLGVIDVLSGQLKQSTELDEIMFPLGWSKDNQYIYVSEHLKKIVIYQYDAKQLTVKNQRKDMGLSAFEVSPSNIIAFEYLSKKFVSYDFDTQKLVPLSGEVDEHMTLAPHKAQVTADKAWLVYEDGMQKAIHRLSLSKDPQQQNSTLVSQLLVPGKINALSGKRAKVLFASGATQQGDIQKLLLSRN